jgi:magnesium transporter
VRPLAAPLERIVAGEVGLLDPRVTEYFRDVNDHLLRAAEQIDGFDELLSGALTANLAQIQVRQNEDMRKITAWVAILAADTLIVSVYGMNFVHVPELTWTFGYPLVLAVMLAMSVALYKGFKRNDWL